jgi:hypothetical protein
MVSRKDKNQATEFIAGLVERSRQFEIQSVDFESVLVKEKATLVEDPSTIEIFLPYAPRAESKLSEAIKRNRYNGIHTCPMLYKDGKTGFVRMVDRSSWRAEESLKLYDLRQIAQMIHLRDVEKTMMQVTELGAITYVQPETARLAPSVRQFTMNPVHLDYSHITEGDPGYGFVEDRVSIDYVLPEEEVSIAGPMEFFLYRHLAMPVPSKARATDCQLDLLETAVDAYIGMEPDEAYKALVDD